MNKKLLAIASAIIVFAMGAFSEKMSVKYQATQLFYLGSNGQCYALTGAFISQGWLTTTVHVYPAEINTAYINTKRSLYATNTCFTRVYFTGI